MGFSWDLDAARYRDDAGKLVAEAKVRAALDTVLTAQAGHARDLTQQMIDGDLSLASWQTQMQSAIKGSHLIGTSVASGGWAQLTKSDLGWTGQRIRAQYRYLANFAGQIAAGEQALDGTALSRAEMYMEAARATYQAALGRRAQGRGMEQERNFLGGAEHSCGQCPAESMRGWVPIGTLIPVGSRTCLSRCHCHLEFRMSPVAAVAA